MLRYTDIHHLCIMGVIESAREIYEYRISAYICEIYYDDDVDGSDVLNMWNKWGWNGMWICIHKPLMKYFSFQVCFFFFSLSHVLSNFCQFVYPLRLLSVGCECTIHVLKMCGWHTHSIMTQMIAELFYIWYSFFRFHFFFSVRHRTVCPF